MANVKNLCYGDGSDGAATVSGALAATKFYTALTVATSTTLTGTNFHIFASISVTLNGTIDNAGNNASGATAGGALAGGPLAVGNYAGTAGQTGVTTTSTATAGTSGVNGGGGSGGGGNSAGTNQSAGSAGTALAATSVTIRCSVFFESNFISNGGVSTTQNWGSNSGATGRGSGDGTRAGGGSAGNAGMVHVASPVLVGGASGAIKSTGGTGGTAGSAPGTGTGGGGGGGAGGAIITVFDMKIGTTVTPTSVGGTHGVAGTTAGNGTNGVAANSVFDLVNA
ncbi:MAG TPA: hypothetical protein VNN79_04075 [Actinomycetota bacterium]|nr:hypothetical protein [Actinomycetota bacterium]